MKTILLVDSMLDDLNRFGEMLSRDGYDVISARDGLTALCTLRDGVPVDLVITEYRIRDMDGLEFVSSVKRFFPHLPIVCLTAYSTLEAYIKAVSLGVFEFMNKPVLARELDTVVKAAIRSAPPPA